MSATPQERAEWGKRIEGTAWAEASVESSTSAASSRALRPISVNVNRGLLVANATPYNPQPPPSAPSLDAKKVIKKLKRQAVRARRRERKRVAAGEIGFPPSRFSLRAANQPTSSRSPASTQQQPSDQQASPLGSAPLNSSTAFRYPTHPTVGPPIGPQPVRYLQPSTATLSHSHVRTNHNQGLAAGSSSTTLPPRGIWSSPGHPQGLPYSSAPSPPLRSPGVGAPDVAVAVQGYGQHQPFPGGSYASPAGSGGEVATGQVVFPASIPKPVKWLFDSSTLPMPSQGAKLAFVKWPVFVTLTQEPNEPLECRMLGSADPVNLDIVADVILRRCGIAVKVEEVTQGFRPCLVSVVPSPPQSNTSSGQAQLSLSDTLIYRKRDIASRAGYAAALVNGLIAGQIFPQEVRLTPSSPTTTSPPPHPYSYTDDTSHSRPGSTYQADQWYLGEGAYQGRAGRFSIARADDGLHYEAQLIVCDLVQMEYSLHTTRTLQRWWQSWEKPYLFASATKDSRVKLSYSQAAFRAISKDCQFAVSTTSSTSFTFSVPQKTPELALLTRAAGLGALHLWLGGLANLHLQTSTLPNFKALELETGPALAGFRADLSTSNYDLPNGKVEVVRVPIPNIWNTEVDVPASESPRASVEKTPVYATIVGKGGSRWMLIHELQLESIKTPMDIGNGDISFACLGQIRLSEKEEATIKRFQTQYWSTIHGRAVELEDPERLGYSAVPLRRGQGSVTVESLSSWVDWHNVSRNAPLTVDGATSPGTFEEGRWVPEASEMILRWTMATKYAAQYYGNNGPRSEAELWSIMCACMDVFDAPTAALRTDFPSHNYETAEIRGDALLEFISWGSELLKTASTSGRRSVENIVSNRALAHAQIQTGLWEYSVPTVPARFQAHPPLTSDRFAIYVNTKRLADTVEAMMVHRTPSDSRDWADVGLDNARRLGVEVFQSGSWQTRLATYFDILRLANGPGIALATLITPVTVNSFQSLWGASFPESLWLKVMFSHSSKAATSGPERLGSAAYHFHGVELITRTLPKPSPNTITAVLRRLTSQSLLAVLGSELLEEAITTGVQLPSALERAWRGAETEIRRARATAARNQSSVPPFWDGVPITSDVGQLARLPLRLLGLLSLGNDMRLDATAGWFQRYVQPRLLGLGGWDQLKLLGSTSLHILANETLGHACRSVQAMMDKVDGPLSPPAPASSGTSAILAPEDDYLDRLPASTVGTLYRTRIVVHGVTIACSVRDTCALAEFDVRQRATEFFADDQRVQASKLLQVEHPSCFPIKTHAEQTEWEVNGRVVAWQV